MIKDIFAANISPMFLDHVAEHGLNFGTAAEFELRQGIFLANEAENILLNSNPAHTFTVGHNFMSTWTEDEFKMMQNKKIEPDHFEEPTMLDVSDIPASLDWRTKGAVNTAIQNQGACGSCWTFGSSATMEGHWAIQFGTLYKLAEQELVDCDHNTANGCQGGSVPGAFQYVRDNGQTLQADYKYTAKNGVCQAADKKKVVYVLNGGVHWVKAQSPSQLIAAIAVGPVAIALEASSSVFRRYKQGTLNSDLCGVTSDHSTTAVGFGIDDQKQKYTIIRNSWGANWGHNGYVHIMYNDSQDGTVGTCAQLCYPTWPTMKLTPN